MKKLLLGLVLATTAYAAAFVSCSDSKGDGDNGGGGDGGGSGNKPYKTVRIGTQNGVIDAGSPGVATFAITTEHIEDGKTGTVTWYDPGTNTNISTPPKGITPSVSAVSNNKALVTMTATAAETGDYYFTVTIDGTASTTSIYLTISSKRVWFPEQDYSVTMGKQMIIGAWVSDIGEGKTGTVQWYTSASGTTTSSSPTGIVGSVLPVENSMANVTIDATEAVSIGTYWFRVIIDGVFSPTATLHVTQTTTLTTIGAIDITSTGAIVGGNITNVGTPPYTERGLYYSTSPNPRDSGTRIVDPGSGTGAFNATLTALTPETIYYVVAYAIQLEIPVYGNVIEFTTPASLSATSLNTNEATAISAVGAILNGNIYSAGTPAYTERGFCYATWLYPTTADNKVVVSGSGTGAFSTTISGLTPYQSYQVRAYVIQGGETRYGGQISFTTLASMPVISTSAPTNITATSATVGGIVHDTGKPAYIDRGVCYSSSPNPGFNDSKIRSPEVATGPFSIQMTGLPDLGLTWYVRAYAIGHYGVVLGDEVSFTTSGTTTIPPAPTNLTATASSSPSQIDLWWWSSPDATGYRVERSANGTSGWTEIASSVVATSYQSTDLSPGTTYYYRVRAYNSAGNSGYSNTANATTQTAGAVPAVPAGLTASASSSSQINLSWTASSGASGYKVERSGNGTSGWSEIAGSVSSPSYQNTGLSSGTTYYYRVRAYNSNGNSGYSNTANATTQTVVTIPAAPAGLMATASSSSQINLSWNTSTGATGYKVERSANGTSGWTEIAPSVTATSYQNTGLSAGTTYYYRVRAYNSAGNSGYSNTANAKTQTPSLVAPALSLVGSQPVSGLFTLRCSYTWPGLVATTDRYELEISENGGSTYSLLLTGADGDRTSPFNFNLETESGDAGKTFYFRARVRTSSEYTPYSTPISVSIAAVPPPIAVKYTRSNALEYYSLDASAANTSYPNQPPSVGNMYMNHVAGYNAGFFAHALYFNVNSQISGKNIKKAELRMYTKSATTEPGVFYTIETIASSWTAAATYNQMLNWNFYSSATKTKAAPASYLSLWAVDVTTSVRNWANGTWSNNGFLLHDTGSYNGYNAYRTTDFIGIENSIYDTVLYIEFQ